MEVAVVQEVNSHLAALAAKDSLIEDLRAQVEGLQEQLDSIQSRCKTPPVLKPFRFLDLPAELREWVYDLCLVKGKIFLRPRPNFDTRYQDYELFERPEWQLLSVNHQVRNEAAKVLLSKNHFVLSNDLSISDYFYTIHSRPLPYRLDVLTRVHLRSVSITLDLRNIGDPIDLADSLTVGYDVDSDLHTTNGYAAKELVINTHAACEDFSNRWADQCVAMSRVKFLQIDITNCYCPLGCHRMIDQVADATRCVYANSIPEVVEVIGVKNARERTSIRQAVKDGLGDSGFKNVEGTLQIKPLHPDDNDEACLELYFHDLDNELQDQELDVGTRRNGKAYVHKVHARNPHKGRKIMKR